MNNINTSEGTEQGSTPSLKPEWLRPKEAIRIFGLGRTKLYELIAAGEIKSVSLRQRGSRHGTRLIFYESLAGYLSGLAEGRQESETVEEV